MRGTSILFALVLLMGCASAPPLNAQPTAETPVAACIAAANADTRRACIGAGSRVCLETPGGETTAGAAACFGAEARQWAALRDHTLAALRERESSAQSSLRDAMLAEHARWMEVQCAYAASIYEGGSLARVVGAQCRRDAQAEITLGLLSRYDEP